MARIEHSIRITVDNSLVCVTPTKGLRLTHRAFEDLAIGAYITDKDEHHGYPLSSVRNRLTIEQLPTYMRTRQYRVTRKGDSTSAT